MSGQSCSCVPAAETRTQPKNYLSIHHFTVYVARGPEVSRVLSITELFGLRMSVESYVAPKVPCNANAVSASDTRSVTADTRTLVSRLWWRSLHRWVIIPREHPQCCACWSTTQRVTGVVLSGKKRGQPLLSERKKISGRLPPTANPPLRNPSGRAL